MPTPLSAGFDDEHEPTLEQDVIQHHLEQDDVQPHCGVSMPVLKFIEVAVR
jgi:hypothetical protein